MPQARRLPLPSDFSGLSLAELTAFLVQHDAQSVRADGAPPKQVLVWNGGATVQTAETEMQRLWRRDRHL